MTGPTRRCSFAELLEGLFATEGISETAVEGDTGHCRCDGHQVALHHDEALDGGDVHAYIDLGPVPSSQQRLVFRNLLLSQLQWAPPCRTVVGLDAFSGHVVLVLRIGFDGRLDGAELAAVLRRSIRQAGTGSPDPAPASGRAGGRRPSRRTS